MADINTILAQLDETEAGVQDVKAAIVEMGGVLPSTDIALLGDGVRSIPVGGRPSAPVSDVNFYDYDGTITHSYTTLEMQELTALPPGPQHDDLIFDGWNWTLQELKDHHRPIEVGALFCTPDGATKIFYEVVSTLPFSAYFQTTLVAQSGTGFVCEVDWGDGSPVSVVDATGSIAGHGVFHTYACVGSYIISIRCTFGSYAFSSNPLVTGPPLTRNGVTKVYFGDNVWRANGIGSLINVRHITFPSYLTNLSGGAAFNGCGLVHCNLPRVTFATNPGTLFDGCRLLQTVSLPPTFNALYGYIFRYVSYLQRLTLPDSMTAIVASSFQTTSPYVSIRSFIVPASITTIGTTAFPQCGEVFFLGETPPALASASAFSAEASAIYYIPKGSMAAYQAGTNWGTAIAKVQEMDDDMMARFGLT